MAVIVKCWMRTLAYGIILKYTAMYSRCYLTKQT